MAARPTLVVNPGSTNTFTFTTSNWYSLSAITIDGTNESAPASCTITNVQADHTIVANYAAILAAAGTPEWWLYQQNTNWATNFNAAALSDPTGKGIPVWQDYVAGTDPLNPASVFALRAGLANGQMTVSLPTTATTPQYQSQRYYAIESSTNLLDPSSWRGVPGWTNVPGRGQILTFSSAPGNPGEFFRGRVWLGP